MGATHACVSCLQPRRQPPGRVGTEPGSEDALLCSGDRETHGCCKRPPRHGCYGWTHRHGCNQPTLTLLASFQEAREVLQTLGDEPWDIADLQAGKQRAAVLEVSPVCAWHKARLRVQRPMQVLMASSHDMCHPCRCCWPAVGVGWTGRIWIRRLLRSYRWATWTPGPWCFWHATWGAGARGTTPTGTPCGC